MLAQRAASEGPRWMRAGETTSIPNRSSEEWENGLWSVNARSEASTDATCECEGKIV